MVGFTSLIIGHFKESSQLPWLLGGPVLHKEAGIRIWEFELPGFRS